MSVYTVNAVTSINGSYLSAREQALGMDRHTLSSDGQLVTIPQTFKEVEKFKETTLGKVLASEAFIKYDLLARNVVKYEKIDLATKVRVGFIGKHKELQVGGQRFVQIGTDYHGDIA
tara:strand:- start:6 stop:356 length:351 start_codon:yes stop_codon:yes gene_type:complete